MADTGFQLLLNQLAKVVGGTVNPKDSHFFSGAIAADGTGIDGIKGCYSLPPKNITTTPVGIILPGPFKAQLASQGEEDNEDEVRLLLLVAPYDGTYTYATLTPFRDLVTAAFRAHMSAGGLVDQYAWVSAGTPAVHSWGGLDYFAWDFTISVHRSLAVTYTA